MNLEPEKPNVETEVLAVGRFGFRTSDFGLPVPSTLNQQLSTKYE